MADPRSGTVAPGPGGGRSLRPLRPVVLVLFATILAYLVVKGAAHLAGALLPGVPDIAENAPLLDLVFSAGVFAPIALVGLAGAVGTRGRLAPGRNLRAWVPLAFAIGVGGIAIDLLYAWIGGGLARGASGAPVWPWWIAGSLMVIFQATAEEIYFRGWLQPVLERHWGSIGAVGLSALSFAVVHLAGEPKEPLTIVNMALGGMLFGLLALRTRGLLAPIAAHFGWNWAESLVFGLDPNPGVGAFGAPFDFDLTGSLWWGGSGEGLNTSVGTSLVLLALILPLAARRTRLRGASAVPGTKPLPSAAPAALASTLPGAKLSDETRRYLLGED